MALELTADTFEDATKEGVVLLDFWAAWCGPCRALTPVIEQLSKEYEGKATIAKINVEKETDLGRKFNVRAIPALFVLKDGEIVTNIRPPVSKDSIANVLDEVLAAAES